MATRVRIPTPLRSLTRGAAEVQGSGDTVADIIDNLETSYPGLKTRLIDEAGELPRFVNIYIGEEDTRFLDSLKTPLKDGDEVTIVLAIAGGR